MLLELLTASLIIMAASLVGVLTAWKQFGSFIERNSPFLVSFAAGVFVMLVWQLLQEIFAEGSSLATNVIWILAGLIGVSVVVKIIPQTHHHHMEHDEDEPHGRLDARRMLIADGFHNLGDGILLAAAFAVSSVLGFATALSVFVHELVQELSEFFVLRQAGYEPKRALRINFGVSATILIGSVGGFFLLETFEMFEIPVLSIAAGALIALLLQDIIPHSLRHAVAKKCTTKHLLTALFGAVLMFVVLAAVPESHAHGDSDDLHEEEQLHD